MANTKLHGMLNLSRIREHKELITTNSKGESVIWVDVIENFDGKPDQYGSTHTIQAYDAKAPEGRRKVFLANLKPVSFGRAEEQKSEPAPRQSISEQLGVDASSVGTGDLPF